MQIFFEQVITAVRTASCRSWTAEKRQANGLNGLNGYPLVWFSRERSHMSIWVSVKSAYKLVSNLHWQSVKVTSRTISYFETTTNLYMSYFVYLKKILWLWTQRKRKWTLGNINKYQTGRFLSLCSSHDHINCTKSCKKSLQKMYDFFSYSLFNSR